MQTSCPLCSSQTTFLFNKQGSPFYACTACRFVFSQPLHNPNLSNTISDFEPAYLNYLGHQLHDNKNHEALVKKLQRHTNLGQGALLDIGCGSGKFVHYLRSKGYDAWGLEPSAALYESFLAGQPHFYNMGSQAFRAHYPGRRFTAVILSDVLEHVPDPRAFMACVADLTAPGGIVFISTPDARSLFARMAGRGWHYYNKYHLSLFSPQNLRQLMGSYGFEAKVQKHLTRYQSLYYIVQYGFNFILHKGKKLPRYLTGINIPVNLHDNMYGIFRKNS